MPIGYFDGHNYRFSLSWTDENNVLQSKTWTIITDFSAAAIGYDEQIAKNKMEEDISSMSNFLQDSSYNPDDIINNMPSVEIPDNYPAENMLGVLYNNFVAAFTNENAQDFEFVIPNSNGQSITIPANYIENNLPVSIVTLIRVFWWALISMYILKDIWHYIDSIRQGDFFLNSEKDIKTEVL